MHPQLSPQESYAIPQNLPAYVALCALVDALRKVGGLKQGLQSRLGNGGIVI